MYFRKIILAFLFIFVCDKLFAATFTVTSNADSGAGTLRQALLDAAANGTATTDFIYFNLTVVTQADVTITIKTQLPDVTANVIIDGTTQPGLALGVSNAKIIITPTAPAQNLNAFNVSKLVGISDAVEFYGLYIEGFAPNLNGNGVAISTTADCKLVIGAPGKGNVICGNYAAVLSYLSNAIIQSNFIGIAPDGVTPFTNSIVMASNEDYDNLLIGGDVQADGNTILCASYGGIMFGTGTGPQITKAVTIKNNYFGTDYKGTTAINSFVFSFIQVNDAYSTVSVLNNVFNASETAIAAFNQATIVVKGNFFGTDKTQTFSLGGPNGQAISESSFINATIGGNAAADQNVFTNYDNPFMIDNTSTTLVLKNKFYCNTYVSTQINADNNYVRIIKLLDNEVSGDAAPGAMVQLYYSSTQCTTCNPNTWFATVTANAAGVWDYVGNTTQNVMVSSTVANNTLGFQPFNVTQSEVTITNFDCHHAGSIELNEKRTGRFQFVWTDYKGNIVSTAQVASGLQPGTYNLQINEAGSCPTATGQFTIIDLTPHVYSETVQLDCNTTTGSFTSFPSTGPGITVAKYYWEDATGKVISNDQTVSGLAAGKYYLYITDSNGCNSAKVLCQVLPPTAAPIIDDSKATVTDANCDASDGSITGITVSNGGSANYYWTRADGTELGFGQTDLTNVPAGQYYFSAKYDFNCPPVQSKVFTVNAKNAITMDETAVAVTKSTCSNNNGSIKGIAVTGATKYQWFDSNNKLAGNSVDLVNAAAGDYHLVASNSSCNKQSQVYTIINTPATNDFPSTFVVTDVSCDQNNGGVTVTFDPQNSPLFYRWAASDGTTLFSNGPLAGVGAGDYRLYVTDGNGCESFYKSYKVNTTPPLQIVAGSEQITNDQCDQGLGSIAGIEITGGVEPYTYNWLDSQQQSISNNENLTDIGPGTYTLRVTDATNCETVAQDYNVTSESGFVPAPSVNNLQLCSGGATQLSVNNIQPGNSYRLYDSAISTAVLDDEPTGVFKVLVTTSRSFYVTQYTGNCESARVELRVTIGLSGVDIPNTFTPNNDGVNDLWVIKGIDKYPGVLVQVFNRYGQKVFESKGYIAAFDGTMAGSVLPPGVYYYIINLNSSCKLLSGSLTIIR